MLSRTAEYALRACVCLAHDGRQDRLRAEDVAARIEVPGNYLSKILHRLSREGILESTRGPRGGFELAVPPDELPLARIVGHFDPALLDEEGRCILGRMRCSDRDPCAAHHRWKGVAAKMREFFRDTSLADLAAQAGEGSGARSR